MSTSLHAQLTRLSDQINTIIVGKSTQVEDSLACLLAGGMRHGRQGFQVQGANAALAVLSALTVLTLVLPNYTVSTPGPVYTPGQLGFVAAASLLLYGAFVVEQTVRSPGDFLPDEEEDHGPPPPDGPREVEIGYQVVPALRGRGVATRACALLLAHAWSHGADLVRAEVEPGNPDGAASRAVLLANGFRADGQLGFVVERPVGRRT